jgi:vacuolar iron transporter family protein
VLARLLEQRGMSGPVALEAARQLSAKDALATHARVELGIDPAAVTNPWHAAFASMISFATGGIVPLAAMLLAPRPIAIWVAGTAVMVALALTGWLAAGLGRLPPLPAIVRTMGGGLLAMAITYGVGRLAQTQI